MTEKWEYITTFVPASQNNWGAAESVKFYNEESGLSRPSLTSKQPPKCAPEFMIAILNNMGELGWELIQIQPVNPGRNEDIAMFGPLAATATYFCAFKRRKATD